MRRAANAWTGILAVFTMWVVVTAVSIDARGWQGSGGRRPTRARGRAPRPPSPAAPAPTPPRPRARRRWRPAPAAPPKSLLATGQRRGRLCRRRRRACSATKTRAASTRPSMAVSAIRARRRPHMAASRATAPARPTSTTTRRATSSASATRRSMRAPATRRACRATTAGRTRCGTAARTTRATCVRVVPQRPHAEVGREPVEGEGRRRTCARPAIGSRRSRCAARRTCRSPRARWSAPRATTRTARSTSSCCKVGNWLNERASAATPRSADRSCTSTPAARDNCTSCHDPHGSPHERMLIAKPPMLCQRCHNHSRHPATIYDKVQLNNRSNQDGRARLRQLSRGHPRQQSPGRRHAASLGRTRS